MSDCAIDDCDHPARPNADLCEGHLKRRSKGQDLHAPWRRERDAPTLEQAALDLADTDTSDDSAYERNLKRLQKVNERSATAKAQKLLEAAIATHRARHLAGMESARAAGRAPGPPRLTLSPDDVHREVSAEGSLRRAARALGVSAAVLHKILKRAWGVHESPIREHLTD